LNIESKLAQEVKQDEVTKTFAEKKTREGFQAVVTFAPVFEN